MMKKAFVLTTMLLVVMLTFAGCGEDSDKDGRLIGNDPDQNITQDAEDGRNGVIDDTERVGDDIRDDVDDAVDDVKDAVTGDDDNKDSKDKKDAAENRNTTGQ